MHRRQAALRIGLVVPGFSAHAQDWCIPALRDFARCLAMRDDVRVIALRYPYARGRYIIDGAETISLGGALSHGRATFTLWSDFLRLIRAEHRRRPFDVLHAFWATESGLLAALAGRLLGVPTLVSLAGGELVALRDIEYGDQRLAWERLKVAASLRLASAVSAGSLLLANLAQPHVGGGRRVHYAPLGVDIEMFNDAPLGADLVLGTRSGVAADVDLPTTRSPRGAETDLPTRSPIGAEADLPTRSPLGADVDMRNTHYSIGADVDRSRRARVSTDLDAPARLWLGAETDLPNTRCSTAADVDRPTPAPLGVELDLPGASSLGVEVNVSIPPALAVDSSASGRAPLDVDLDPPDGSSPLGADDDPSKSTALGVGSGASARAPLDAHLDPPAGCSLDAYVARRTRSPIRDDLDPPSPVPLAADVDYCTRTVLDRNVERPPAFDRQPLRDFRSAAKFVHVASLTPVKDQDTLLRALAALRRVGVPATLELVGDGPLRARLEHLVDALRLHAAVRFRGEVDHSYLAEMYRSASAFVLSSRHEAQSVVALEAAACGLPVAGTRVGLIPELTAAVAPIADPVALAEAMSAALATPAGERSKTAERVRAQYSLQACTDRFRQLYVDLM